MTIERRVLLQGAALAAALGHWPVRAMAQTRAETLRYVTGATINTLDLTQPGSTRESFGLSMNVYDRLFAFGRKKLGQFWVFDADTITGELAQGYEISPDKKVITIKLRPDAVWHDGSPVTADDVKWSLDRHVTSKSLAGPQLSTGSITTADQFKIVDPHTVTLTLDKPDRLALANLCVCYAIMINSKLAKQHATEADPLGAGVDEDQHRGRRRLHHRQPQARREHHLAPQREVEERHAARAQAHHHPDRAGSRDPGQPDRSWRRRPGDRSGRVGHPQHREVGQGEGAVDPADQRVHAHHHEHPDEAVR